MNILRWTFGIPIALGLSVFIFSLIRGNSELAALTSGNFYFKIYFTMLMVILCSTIFVFLSSLLVPAPKLFGALISSAISFTYTIYWMVSTRHPFSLPSHITFYIGIYAGIIAGFALSFLLFNNRGWKKET